MLSWLGFNQTSVGCDRDERFLGATKYPLRKMPTFAIDGITPFSDVPLRFASYLALTVSTAAFVYALVIVNDGRHPVSGRRLANRRRDPGRVLGAHLRQGESPDALSRRRHRAILKAKRHTGTPAHRHTEPVCFTQGRGLLPGETPDNAFHSFAWARIGFRLTSSAVSLDVSQAPAPVPRHVAVVGAGFTGLTAAWELIKAGCMATLIESDDQVGGLAGGFAAGGTLLEKFYHHWFNNDYLVTELVHELGLSENLIERQTRTGMYYAQSLFRLSKPLDLLRFSPLAFVDRLRLAALVFQSRAVRDWRSLEEKTVREWLLPLCGPRVYRVVWEPLMRGKFGNFADEISAVWLWNKLCLRGGSRDRNGNEVLLYYRGGFASLARQFAEQLNDGGARVRTSCRATGVRVDSGNVSAVLTTQGPVACDAVVFTTPLPITAQLLESHLPSSEVAALRRIRYLSNVCLVLRLDRSLSDLYWINVNDPSFPFVGVIEHTNFEPSATYNGEHIVYLSRYLPIDDPTYALSDQEYLEFALPYICKMFPAFDRDWLRHFHVWRADYAQPVVERRYSSLIPPTTTSLQNAFIATMAQIYPEDRGTNYAIRSGRDVGRTVAAQITR